MTLFSLVYRASSSWHCCEEPPSHPTTDEQVHSGLEVHLRLHP